MLRRMPMPRKPTPEKSCEACGSRMVRKRLRDGSLESLLHFGRRKFCDKTCMAEGFRGRTLTAHPGWSAGHYRARQLIAPGPCSTCGKPNARDVHHKDGDHTNNARPNLIRLCRSCHVRVHRPRRTCSLCTRPHKGHGYCDMHYQRWRSWGDPLQVGPPSTGR